MITFTTNDFYTQVISKYINNNKEDKIQVSTNFVSIDTTKWSNSIKLEHDVDNNTTNIIRNGDIIGKILPYETMSAIDYINLHFEKDVINHKNIIEKERFVDSMY